MTDFPVWHLCVCVRPFRCPPQKKSAKEIHSSSRGDGQRRPRAQATVSPLTVAEVGFAILKHAVATVYVQLV